MTKLNMYMVFVECSAENTDWYVAANTPTEAAALYLKEVVTDGEVSIDAEELDDEGSISVKHYGDGLYEGSEPRVFPWDENEIITTRVIANEKTIIPLDEFPLWGKFVDNDFSPIELDDDAPGLGS